ncbi:MAG: polysaccharide biosynthesis tyrosine autokinase, partial [Actinomycetota bacterium]|nr:polysaccharide biosynthesis tyrosine autokinase [Actinomycetota bacterium]
YAATAQLGVSTPSGGGADAYQGGLFSQARVTSYAELITGQEIAARVVEDPGIGGSPQDTAEQLTSTVVPETVLFNLTATDPDPGRAQLLANAVADEFTRFVERFETPPGKANAPINAEVTDAADLPTSPVSPQVVRNVGLAAVLGLLLGIGLAVLRETLDTSVKNVGEVEEVLGASVLGTVRFDSGAEKRPLITELDSHHQRVEAFRVLRTNLQFVDVDSPSRVYVVSSSLPDEGKTTTASNLAIMLAQAGLRVCLVETDLRRPKLSDYLRVESAVGLTTVLIGRIDLADAVQHYGDDGLHVLTSGANPPNPAELLQSRGMSDVVTRLRQHYDIVLLDAPPLLPVTDAALLGAQADGVLVVVRHGSTSRDQLREAGDRLTAVGARVIGAVLNRAPTRGGDAYGYGYGYGYGYRPEPGRRRVEAREVPQR